MPGNRGREGRTPIYGFGDRCSAIELFPYARLLQTCLIVIAQACNSVKCFFNIFNRYFLLNPFGKADILKTEQFRLALPGG